MAAGDDASTSAYTAVCNFVAELPLCPDEPVMIMRKPPEISREIAKRFLRDMRDFHAELNPIKRDQIAAGTLHMLKEQYRGELRLADVKRLFDQVRDELE